MRLTRKTRELILEIASIIIGSILILSFYTDNLLLFFLFLIILMIVMRFWFKKRDIHFFLIGAIIGTIGEIICTNFGVWKYTNPTFLGIPIWLPLAWGLASVLIKRIVETLSR